MFIFFLHSLISIQDLINIVICHSLCRANHRWIHFIIHNITIKINSSDFTHGGIEEPECLAICQLLDQAGIDSIEVSGNGTAVSGIKPHVNEGYFVPVAAKVAKRVSCPVIVVGGFRSLDGMESVLNQTDIAFISLSRPLLREPDLPNKMKADSTIVSQCVSCNACYSSKDHKCVFRNCDTL